VTDAAEIARETVSAESRGERETDKPSEFAMKMGCLKDKNMFNIK
jgi:hypothetical protein